VEWNFWLRISSGHKVWEFLNEPTVCVKGREQHEVLIKYELLK